MNSSPTASRDCSQPWSAIWTRQPLCAAAGRGGVDHALFGEAVVRPREGLLIEHDELASRFRGGILERAIDPGEDCLCLIVVAVADIGLGRDATGCSALLGDESVAALLLHQIDVRLRRADLLEKVPRRFHHPPLHGLILVAGEEIDVVARQLRREGRSAVPGKLFCAFCQDLRVGNAQGRLHTFMERLLRVLSHRHGPERNELARLGFGASERTAGDDAGADDLTRMSDFDLTCHVRSRGEARDGGRRKVSAERRQLLGGRRVGREDRGYDPAAAKTIVSTSSARRFFMKLSSGTAWRASASPLGARRETFLRSFCLMGQKPLASLERGCK